MDNAKYDRGVTLIEGVLFISIALGLIVGGLVFYNQAQQNRQFFDVSRQLQQITASTRAISLDPGSICGFEDCRTNIQLRNSIPHVLYVTEALPPSMFRVNGTATRIISPWGGLINVWATNSQAGDADKLAYIIVTLTDVPTKICPRLTTSDTSGRTAGAVDVFRVTWIRPTIGIDGEPDYSATYRLPDNKPNLDFKFRNTRDGITLSAASQLCSDTEFQGTNRIQLKLVIGS